MHVLLSHWSASGPALVCYAVVAAAHLAGLWRLPAARGPVEARARRNQALLFQGGLLTALLTLVSPIGYWSDIYIWIRALQFLLLAFVSTGLMVLGAPWEALRAAIHWVSRASQPAPKPDRVDDRGPGRVPWLLAWPRVAVVAANVVWLAWQLPALFDAAKGNNLVALASHACYLAAGLVLWLQLIGSRPFSPPTRPLRRVRFVVGSVVATTVLGMVLVFSSGVFYPVYAGAAHHVMTVLDDQQLSGAVIWMGSLLPLITAAVALLLQWLNEEDSAELSAGLDRLLTPRKNAWSARPGIR